MIIQAKQIRNISQELQCGLKIFINRETQELKSIPDPNDLYDDLEFWKDDLDKIENEWTDCITIEKMESWEAFKIMEAFVAEVQDESFKQDLTKILNRKSPFANFKAEVETSHFRQKWFDFKDKKYEEFVIQQLKQENIEIEEKPPAHKAGE